MKRISNITTAKSKSTTIKDKPVRTAIVPSVTKNGPKKIENMV